MVEVFVVTESEAIDYIQNEDIDGFKALLEEMILFYSMSRKPSTQKRKH